VVASVLGFWRFEEAWSSPVTKTWAPW